MRGLRLLALTALGLLLVGCAGLPTSGPPMPGLAIGEESPEDPFVLYAQGPRPGDGPEDIVKGFLEASISPAGNWETAQEFLTEEFRKVWKPGAGVTVDDSVTDREFDPSVDADDESASEAEVQARFDQVAGVDGDGRYSAFSSTATATYQLRRTAEGEWRISKANDGIVLDAETFQQVYQKYALKYFDPGWTHLVPDVRWFPRRQAMATTIARALITGAPSDWLAPAVRSAFSADLSLTGDAVTVDPTSQAASVALPRAALSLSATDLSRMRTQLEQSLVGVGVSEVRFTVDGTALAAATVPVEQPIVDPGVLVLDEETFGRTVSGDVVEPVAGLTGQLAKITDPVGAVDVSLDAALAAVQLRDGRVLAVSPGEFVELDSRADLIKPSLDPFGFTWTVPRTAPAALEAWSEHGDRHPIEDAWQGAESISCLRVSADGARVAAVVTTGGQHRLVVAAVVRDEDSVPAKLGEVHEIGRIDGPAQGLAWVGADTLAVLSTGPDPALTSYVVGGPVAGSPALPEAAVALSGAKTPTGVRVLASDGAVYAQRGSSWQVALQDVLLLGTRAGY
ncbi:LpqB family beta-propeller domain-containing protein [Microbacterium soli]|uniref:GerMN domain-containing protein n=1 Tax=Microbacterium soli TaxID=446075 RepID=A0ABP7MR80_9MICO